jgi:hypothetical protein
VILRLGRDDRGRYLFVMIPVRQSSSHYAPFEHD